MNDTPGARLHRREILAALAGAGVASPVLARAIAAQVDEPKRADELKKAPAPGPAAAKPDSPQAAAKPADAADADAITPEMIKQAEWVAGISLTDAQRVRVAKSASGRLASRAALDALPIPIDVPPAHQFDADPFGIGSGSAGDGQLAGVPLVRATAPRHDGPRPAGDDDLAFLPIAALGALLRRREITSTELAKLSLARLHRSDEKLKCVVTFTDELALRQAAKADRELAAGRDRGPLHGIPWAAKDLIAYPGFPTTWGAEPFRTQTFEQKATVAQRLDDAGAVLCAKTTLGALAEGDRWFGGRTRNPWNTEEGSSGSSAGSASAVAAGLVPFAIGSETWGSILSPAGRCGATGLRPTFGRISRAGCMTLSWSMDKIGPLTRSVDDAALVFATLLGRDGIDPTVREHGFVWPGPTPTARLRVGIYPQSPGGAYDAIVKVLREAGATIIPVAWPADLPSAPLALILSAESAESFRELTRAGLEKGLNNWPDAFRRGRFVSAADYLRACRLKTLWQRRLAALFEQVDVYLGGDLLATNATGHPQASVPSGFARRQDKDVPEAAVFTGRPWGEADLLAVAKLYQDATGHHLRRPPA